MTEIRVSSWIELQEKLYEGAWRPELQRFRSPYAFRGLRQIGHGLETTLRRLGGDYAGMERHLLRNFRKYARRSVVENDSIWNWLSLAKHHGLPTRLLDWSFSPFVAMHFVTANEETFDVDGQIWAVDYTFVHRHLPARLQQALRREGSDVFTVEMLSSTVPTLDDFDALKSEGENYVLFFEPPSLDERIVNQFALFSMMTSATATLEEWLQHHPAAFRKIIIPAELKWEIRDKLDQANITERVLFPGLDGLSRWLRRQYSARSAAESDG